MVNWQGIGNVCLATWFTLVAMWLAWHLLDAMALCTPMYRHMVHC